MKYINSQSSRPLKIKLTRNLNKQIKKGHPWIFSDAIMPIDMAEPPGQLALLIDTSKEIISTGIYNGKSNLAFRALTFINERVDESWIESRLENALKVRSCFLTGNIKLRTTNCFRLINGEGDQLPGLICDVYDYLLVFQTDGEGATRFWNVEEIAKYFLAKYPHIFSCAYHKYKASKDRDQQFQKGREIIGECPKEIIVRENSILFQVNIVDGAKTGLFLDQRDSRMTVSKHSLNLSVLNLFGYTGGFSLFAGEGGAREITTVDIAPKAIEASKINWTINNLNTIPHQAICSDVFEFLNQSKTEYDFIIVDPPSFATSEEDIENATRAYKKLFTASLGKLKSGGLFAASSCSGHINFDQFSQLLTESFQLAKKRSIVLQVSGQPFDHPYPFSCPELRYLKFFLFCVV